MIKTYRNRPPPSVRLLILLSCVAGLSQIWKNDSLDSPAFIISTGNNLFRPYFLASSLNYIYKNGFSILNAYSVVEGFFDLYLSF